MIKFILKYKLIIFLVIIVVIGISVQAWKIFSQSGDGSKSSNADTSSFNIINNILKKPLFTTENIYYGTLGEICKDKSKLPFDVNNCNSQINLNETLIGKRYIFPEFYLDRYTTAYQETTYEMDIVIFNGETEDIFIDPEKIIKQEQIYFPTQIKGGNLCYIKTGVKADLNCLNIFDEVDDSNLDLDTKNTLKSILDYKKDSKLTIYKNEENQNDKQRWEQETLDRLNKLGYGLLLNGKKVGYIDYNATNKTLSLKFAIWQLENSKASQADEPGVYNSYIINLVSDESWKKWNFQKVEKYTGTMVDEKMRKIRQEYSPQIDSFQRE